MNHAKQPPAQSLTPAETNLLPLVPETIAIPSAEALDESADVSRFTRGDPLAVALFRFLELRSDADAEHVLAAAAARRAASADASSFGLERASRSGPATSDSARVTLSRYSLSAAAKELRRVPSRRDYDRWYAGHPDRKELATSSFIRRTFDDSWHEAVAQIGAPVADFTARRLLRNGKAFSQEQRDLAIRLFVEAVEPGGRTQAAFERWTRAYVLTPAAYDIPTSAQGLLKGRGIGWHDLLESIGAGEDRYRVLKTIGGVKRASRKTPEQMLDLVRRCAVELGVPAPTSLEYEGWAKTLLDEQGRRLAPNAQMRCI